MKHNYSLFFLTSLIIFTTISGETIHWPIDPLVKKSLSEKEEDFFLQNRPIVISLGDSCQPALNLTLNKLRFMSYPFDWTIARYEDLYDIIKTDFKYLKNKNLFQMANNPAGNNMRPTNTCYPQLDFPHMVWETLFESLNKRIDRFNKTIQFAQLHSKKVFFIIHSNLFKDNTIKDKVLNLNALLIDKFPNLNFTLIAMHHFSEIPDNLQEKNCIFCYLQHNGWDQNSYNEWKNKFTELGLINIHAKDDSDSEHPFV